MRHSPRLNSIRRPGGRGRCRHGGFTLMETALAMVIIGVGLLAMLDLIAAGTAANVDGVNETMGMNLARNVRELSLKSTFADVLAMDNRTYTTPVDSRGVALSGFDGWQQIIDVQAVDVRNLKWDNVNPTPDVVRVTVRVTRNGEQVCQLVWYRFRPVS